MFGFMPIGLFYHACYSLVAATLCWFFAIKFAWPKELVEWALKRKIELDHNSIMQMQWYNSASATPIIVISIYLCLFCLDWQCSARLCLEVLVQTIS